MEDKTTGNNNLGVVIGTIIQKGKNSTININNNVNEHEILREVNYLRDIVSSHSLESENKVNRVLDDIAEELQKSEPDKDEIGESIERFLKLLKKADAFIDIFGKICKPINKIASWLGGSWGQVLDRFNKD